MVFLLQKTDRLEQSNPDLVLVPEIKLYFDLFCFDINLNFDISSIELQL